VILDEAVINEVHYRLLVLIAPCFNGSLYAYISWPLLCTIQLTRTLCWAYYFNSKTW